MVTDSAWFKTCGHLGERKRFQDFSLLLEVELCKFTVRRRELWIELKGATQLRGRFV